MAVRQLGPFELMEKIGAGGMGYVYRAKYTKTGQIVAVKLLPPGLNWNDKVASRFERELAILKRLKHPNIVRCYGGGITSNQRFYAMELVEGGSLAKLVKDKTKLSWEEVVDYSIQICKALEHAHENGIIHRDLKPPNLLLSKEGVIKLADFGIALDVEATALTAEGKTVGTFSYMAPEQICGKPPVSPKTDLYALGCVMYKMLTGDPPFDSDASAEVLHQHMYKQPVRVTAKALDCPVWLDSLVMKLLEKNPFDRPADAAAVIRALEEIKQKAGEQVGVTRHASAAAPTSFHLNEQATVVSKYTKKKKKKIRENVPVYERVWFLVLALGLVIGGIVWGMWPKNEEQLFAAAETAMASDNPADWEFARSEYLEPILQRFPDGKRKAEAQAYLDKIEMHYTEKQFLLSNKLGKQAQSEAERLYGVAWNFEKFGDLLNALEKYQAMITLLGDQAKDRPWVNLARRQVAKIQEEGSNKFDRLALIQKKIAEGDELAAKGQAIEARQVFQSIVTLYEKTPELEVMVKKAQNRLDGKKDDEKDDESEPETETESVPEKKEAAETKDEPK